MLRHAIRSANHNSRSRIRETCRQAHRYVLRFHSYGALDSQLAVRSSFYQLGFRARSASMSDEGSGREKR